jgi:hypothetical protein
VTFISGVADEDAYFELSFSPNVRLVPTVRRFVSEFYAGALHSNETISQLAVATHELLENAVRYSTDGNTMLRVGLKRKPATDRVTIDTRNHASPSSIDVVRRLLDELAAAPDPDVYYQLLMRRSAKRTDGSGLGLGRVRAESGMDLSYAIDGCEVHVHAQAEFPHQARAAGAMT